MLTASCSYNSPRCLLNAPGLQRWRVRVPEVFVRVLHQGRQFFFSMNFAYASSFLGLVVTMVTTTRAIMRRKRWSTRASNARPARMRTWRAEPQLAACVRRDGGATRQQQSIARLARWAPTPTQGRLRALIVRLDLTPRPRACHLAPFVLQGATRAARGPSTARAAHQERPREPQVRPRVTTARQASSLPSVVNPCARTAPATPTRRRQARPAVTGAFVASTTPSTAPARFAPFPPVVVSHEHKTQAFIDQ